MPTGIVTAIGLSRAQKPVITIDNQRYSASKVETGSLRIGDRVEFDSSSSVFNGATIWHLNAWKLVEGATKYPPTERMTASSLTGIAPLPPLPLGAPVQDAERPAISNWIAAAIAAGLIKDHVDIISWVMASKTALRTDSTFSETDSDIP